MSTPEFTIDDMLRLGAENNALKVRLAELERKPLLIGDMKNMDGYELVYGSEGVGNHGCSGVKLFVRRYPKTLEHLKAVSDVRPGGRLSEKEKENHIFSRVGREAERVLAEQAARLDPQTWEREKKTKADFAKAFADAGLSPVFMEPIPNEYWPSGIPEASIGDPWYNVATCIGYIKVGWRKRVIHLDWLRSTIRISERQGEPCEPVIPSGQELFPDDDVTRGDGMIHAYGYEKLTGYLKKLLSLKPNET